MEKFIIVSDELWAVVDAVSPEYDNGLFKIRDDVGGEALVGDDEIEALIEALRKVPSVKKDWNSEQYNY